MTGISKHERKKKDINRYEDINLTKKMEDLGHVKVEDVILSSKNGKKF